MKKKASVEKVSTKAKASKKASIKKVSTKTKALSRKATPPLPKVEESFFEVVRMIEASREKTYQAINTALVELYWQIGEYISRKLQTAEWGEGVVAELAHYIVRTHPNLKGFTRSNLFRMRQLWETYSQNEIVAALPRQLSWTHNLLILGQCKRQEEREFYLRMAARERWSSRELARQLKAALFERAVLHPPKTSQALKRQHPEVETIFKDCYLFEFLGLTIDHSEADLHSGLLRNLGRFLTELGRDFCFVGSEYPVQVGNQDFAIDLLFYHRELQCLVAIELKAGRFEPAHLGQLEFYLEALDRDLRKSHERPSIGVLLCATKDDTVVEYALSRSLSPALIAEYEAHLPDKKLLRAKLAEFYQLLAPVDQEDIKPKTKRAKKGNHHDDRS